MISFAICEDETILANEYKKEIDNFMMQYDIDYKCYLFACYDQKWEEFAAKNDTFKIYLLDLKTKQGSGIDAARIIREEFDDWSSMIIMITAFSEYKYEALSKRLMLVDFINKLDNWKTNLRKDLNICLKNHDQKYKSLKYEYKNMMYNIELRKILYIEKEQDSKRCIIKTTYGTSVIPGTIKDVKELLDKRFALCSRSMIINTEQIESYNTKTNIILLKNGQQLNVVSRNKKKEIENYVRGIY